MSETAESAERKEKFTPGPWEVTCDGNMVEHASDDIADLFGENYKANAALIAAAPDMYAALVKAVADYGKPGGPWNVPSEPGTWIHSATSALSKARGES